MQVFLLPKKASQIKPEKLEHKAHKRDMHIGSNAIQRRFAPQPVSRSSWLQLVVQIKKLGWWNL